MIDASVRPLELQCEGGDLKENGIKEDGVTALWKNPVAFACKDNDWHTTDLSYKNHRNKMKSCKCIRKNGEKEEEFKFDELLKKLKTAAVSGEAGSRHSSPGY